MNGSNIDPRNSIHRSPLRGTYLLIAGLLGGFGLFIALALAGFGVLSRAQATNAAPPPDPALTGHFGRMFRNLPPFAPPNLSLIHISEPTRLLSISYAVFCLKKK